MREANRRVTIAGGEGGELLPNLVTHPSDYTIVKKRHSAFFRTSLDELLRTLEPSHLVLGGINSHACVRSTAVDAYARDYQLYFAEDCISSYDPEFHRESMRYLQHALGEVRSSEEIFRQFGPRAPS